MNPVPDWIRSPGNISFNFLTASANKKSLRREVGDATRIHAEALKAEMVTRAIVVLGMAGVLLGTAAPKRGASLSAAAAARAAEARNQRALCVGGADE